MDPVSNMFSNHISKYPWIETFLGRGFRVLVIIAGVFLCAKLIHLVCVRILETGKASKKLNENNVREREKRLATVVKLVDTTMRVTLYSLAGLMVLRELGLDITPLLTGAGIAGVALGFGAQSLVKDVISGFFILLEDQIRVGDVIKINSALSGAVERMELRVTAIRDGDGTLHIIPNGEIKSVSNMTYDFSQAVVTIPIPYSTDLNHLSKILTEVAQKLGEDPAVKSQLRSEPEFVGVTDFYPSYMTVQISVKTEPHSRWAVTREIRARVKNALDGAGIKFAALISRDL